MNIDEVLKFASTLAEDEAAAGQAQSSAQEGAPGPSKRPRLDEGPSGLTQEEIARMLEETEAQPFVEVTEAEIKRLVGLLEKRYNKNQEMRIKYADDPGKFMDSEMELFDTVKEIGCITTRPDLNNFLSKQKLVPTLLSLLSHDNLDLVNAVIVLLSEILCIEEAEELPASMALIDAFFKNQLVQLLIQTMDRYVDSNVEESEQYMTPILEIFEYFNEKEILTPDTYPADMKLLIKWLLQKMKSLPVFSASKYFASEILSANVQVFEKNKMIFNQLHGVDTILRVLAHYKRTDPEGDQEEELMKNLFNVLCASLQDCPANRQSFYDDEGLELMNLIVKERRDPRSETEVRSQALQVVNHCFSIAVEDDLLPKFADKYIEMLGLRVLMPVFQKPSAIVPAKLPGTRKEREEKKAELLARIEEHSVTILVSLLKYASPANTPRLLAKFIESEHVKTERLAELYCKYFDLFSAQQATGSVPADDDSTFFILQFVCQLILMVCSPNEARGRTEEMTKDIKEKLWKLLKMNPSHKASFQANIKAIGKQLAMDKGEAEAKELLEMIELF